jgi:hypothetical protein
VGFRTVQTVAGNGPFLVPGKTGGVLLIAVGVFAAAAGLTAASAN